MKRIGHRLALRGEGGAETVEFALALPILLVVAMAAIQLCLMGFQALALEKQTTSGAWSVSASEIAASTEPEEVMKKAICDNGVLKEENLEISNMEVTTLSSAKDDDLTGDTVYARVDGKWQKAYTVSGSKDGVEYEVEGVTAAKPDAKATDDSLTWSQYVSNLKIEYGLEPTGNAETDATNLATRDFIIEYLIDIDLWQAIFGGSAYEWADFTGVSNTSSTTPFDLAQYKKVIVKLDEITSYTDEDAACTATISKWASVQEKYRETAYATAVSTAQTDLASRIASKKTELTSAYKTWSVSADGGSSGTASSGVFSEYVADRGTCSVSCDVTYSLSDVLAIPGLSGVKVTRHIECTLIDHNRAEVK